MAPSERKSATAALVLTAIGGLAAIAVAASELPAIRHGDGSRRSVAFAAIFIVIVALGELGYVASLREHQLRGVSGEIKRYGPVSSIAVGVVAAGIAVTAFVAALGYQATGATSHRTQSEGVQAFATVLRVDSVKHTAGYDTWYGARVIVAQPNKTAFYVYDPQKPAFGPGQRVRVLIDPINRAHVEFPGLPQQGRYTWIGALFICLMAAALSAGSFASARQMRRGARPRQVMANAVTA